MIVYMENGVEIKRYPAVPMTPLDRLYIDKENKRHPDWVKPITRQKMREEYYRIVWMGQ